MRETAMWAFWRRLWYGTGFGLFWVLVGTGVYFLYVYEPANCFDGMQNGEERGIDCGGACLRVCAADVAEPTLRWVQSFRVREGQYNIVAYIENTNRNVATPELPYSYSLYDDAGLIVENEGTTVLPPDSVYPIFLGPIFTQGREPTNTFLELGDVSVWLPAESSRGQFRVTDRELVGADMQPRLNVDIENKALIAAEDVEVVATIFDANGNALTSSRTYVDYFAPQTTEDLVFTWPEPIAKTLRSCEVPTDVVLAIDLSGSMNNDQANPPEPISSVLTAAEAFVSRLKEKDKSAVVTFASDAITARTLTNDPTQVSTLIANLSIDPEEETGSTNTGDAFVRAQEELQSGRHNPDARKVLVILTDGLATAPDADPEAYAIEKAQELKDSGVEVYAIGLGEQVNMQFVNTIASDSNNAFQALTRGQINQIYQTITGAICEDGAAVIDVIPKTESSIRFLE